MLNFMHTPSLSHRVFHWQISKKIEMTKWQSYLLGLHTKAEQPFQFVLFHKQICTSFSQLHPIPICYERYSLGYPACDLTAIANHLLPFQEKYSFGFLYFQHRHCGKYFLKGGTGKCPILFGNPPQLSCQDVMCLRLALHWCLSTGASL